MDKIAADIRIKELRESIEYNAKLYYEKDAPVISDYEYDRMFEELKQLEKEGKVEKDPITGRVNFNFREVNRKVIVPTDQEILENPRSRSAKLRILEKIGD